MSRIGKLGCYDCNWTGVTRHTFWNGETEETSVTMCSKCKDTVGYSIYIKNKYSNQSNLRILDGGVQLATVIDFEIFKESKEMKYYSKEEAEKMGNVQFLRFGQISKRD